MTLQLLKYNFENPQNELDAPYIYIPQIWNKTGTTKRNDPFELCLQVEYWNAKADENQPVDGAIL
jgi:hypothetical protein